MVEKVRRWTRRTFLDGEGELRNAGAISLLAVLLGGILVLEVVGSAPVALYLALFGTFGYVAGQRRGAARVSEVEPVAPPFIPSQGE